MRKRSERSEKNIREWGREKRDGREREHARASESGHTRPYLALLEFAGMFWAAMPHLASMGPAVLGWTGMLSCSILPILTCLQLNLYFFIVEQIKSRAR